MLEQAFINFGYTKEEYNEIRNSYILKSYFEEKLLEKFKENTTYLLELGYTKEEVIKMTKSLPAIYGYSIENMKQKLTDIMSLGYTKEEVIKMTKSLPAIYGLSIENMKQKLTDVISLGYTKEEGIKMTKTCPSIYGYSIENMKQKLTDVMSLGYTKEEVLQITTTFPAIYSLSIETIRQKIEFYDSINMHLLAVQDSKQLMQSVALSYARYQFYLSIGIIIDISNYKKLFIGNKSFEKTYGITKEELLVRYPYEQYTEEKNNGRTI